MQCYTELTPPTAVTHSLSLPFLSASANNLIVAKTSLLQVFSLKSIVTTDNHTSVIQGGNAVTLIGSNEKDQKHQRNERLHTTKLVLVSQYELSGTVTALTRVKTLRSKSGGEAILVALKDAKLSLVEWNPERYSISTISIHYYEREDLQGSPWAPELGHCANILTVDPSSRCAALKFGSRNVAILPFHQSGDDLVMDGYDSDSAESQGKHKSHQPQAANGANHAAQTPYAASFVLSLLTLDPSLTHPVHLAFLHEYREPTIGILSSQVACSGSLLHERRDPLFYTVFTLDLEQRASTTLLSVTKLPYDLHTVIPLALPVGGALLVGTNEIIHVDQAGKTNGVAVNEFAKQCSSFILTDQSDLGLRLEGSVLEQMNPQNGDMLIILPTGNLAVLRFKIDGRSVSGLSIQPTLQGKGERLVLAGASCISTVGRGRVFVGSEDAESIILGWSRKFDKAKKQRARADMNADVDEILSDAEEDLDDDDDLYSGAILEEKILVQPSYSTMSNSFDEYLFRVHDSLMSLAPIRDLAFGGFTQKRDEYDHLWQESEVERGLMITSGRGSAGALNALKREISPLVASLTSVGGTYGIWSICVKPQNANDTPAAHDGEIANFEYDRFMITTSSSETGGEFSNVYSMIHGSLEEIKGSDFDPSTGATVEVGMLNNGTQIVQILGNEIRTYDAEFSLAQIFPLSDDDSETGPKVLTASFSDPFVLLVKDGGSIMMVKGDDSGDLEEVERKGNLLMTKYISGTLYEDSNDVFRLESNGNDEFEGGNVLMFLLTFDGGLQIYRMSNLDEPVYVTEGLSFLPPFLTTEFTVRRNAAKETLTEILIAELGDNISKSPYLILRSATNELTIYQAYQSPIEGSSKSALRFLKISNPYLPKMTGESLVEDNQERIQSMRILPNVGGYSSVFVPGRSPCFIIKAASYLPQIINLKSKGVRALSTFHRPDLRYGFTYVEYDETLYKAQLSPECDYSIGWVTKRIWSGEEVRALDYHERSDRYVLGVIGKVSFKLPDDELHPDWSKENTNFLPQVEQGCIKLLEPTNWTIVDSYDLDLAEIIISIKTMDLETSEHSHNRRPLIVVGTALLRGEDLPTQGRIYVFDIIEVVPEPDHPGTDRKLKLIAKEEVKGAVTALSEIGTEGFLLAAQGQKCMVRGLKDDGTLLPVAFIDMQCYVSVVKELRETGLCLMGDATKGLWFTGYSEDPYQLRLFSKTSQHIEVITAEFLPHDQQLYIIAIDADSNLHVLQFDPESPKSLTGQRLLHLSTFHIGAYPSTSTLLAPPPSPLSETESNPPFPRILLTSSTGSLSLLTSLSGPAYRTLSALQSYLLTTLPHPLGLNPRAYRNANENLGVESAGRGGFVGRGVLDGTLLKRWMELGSWKRGEGEARCGEEGAVVRGLIARVSGGCGM